VLCLPPGLGARLCHAHPAGQGVPPLRAALLDAACIHGLRITPKVAGPSNIGNYLAGLGIPTTAGFGGTYQGLHATDERIRTDTIPAVQTVYHTALAHVMGTTPDVPPP
jgi:succinyl-diaminopimelate desuccinylase